MSLRSGSIPSLVQGVSQQPAALRLPTQLELQENCHSSVVEGLIRRPPTEHVTKISDTALDTAFHHTINRDPTERYNAIISDTGIKVFTVDGVEKTVNYQDEVWYLLVAITGNNQGAAISLKPAPGETSVDYTVSGIGTATVALQFSTDNGQNYSNASTRTSDGTTTGVAIPVGATHVRLRTTSYTSGVINGYITYKTLRYLECVSPPSQLKALTIADFTFLLNTTTVVAMKNKAEDLSPTRNSEGLVFVRQGNYGSVYEILINGTSAASYTTSNTDVDDLGTDNIATQLLADLVAGGYNTAPWSSTRKGSVIHISNSSTDFNLAVVDSQGGDSLGAFKDVTVRFSELPATAPNGFVIAIDANPDTLAGKYYVKAVTTQSGDTFGPATWRETLAGGLETQYYETTMPHALVRQGDGTFLYKTLDWTQRLVGDDDSNSLPSFVGTTIQDIFFYKNRIGILADEFFVCSQTGEYFNFWRTTVTQQLDTDPIDSRAVNVKVSLLKHAIPFNTDLILFSDQTQFKIPGDVALTPKTVRCDPTAEFESNIEVKPVNAGKSIYFIFNRGDYAGLKELFLAENVTNVMDATDLTAHVPAYMPSGVFSMSNSTLADCTVFLTTSDPSAAYVYKVAYQDKSSTKIQAAWYRWSFGPAETTTVLSAKFIESVLYLVIQRGSKVYQEKMLLQPSRTDTDSTYVTHLDRRFDETILTVSEVGPSYDVDTNTTLFPNLPYEPDANTVIVTKAGQVLQIQDYDSDSLLVLGDHSEDEVWIGQKYESRAELSTIFIRKQTANGGTTIDEVSRLQLLRGYLNYANTGYFKVSVTPEGRDQSDSIFTGNIVGQVQLGTVGLHSGRFSFGVFAKNDQVSIEIVSDSFLPFAITSAEWEGNYTKRSGG